jgi:hypothetical protein
MTRYRPRAVLLLFLLLHLTACQTWQPVSLNAISPAQFIEEAKPDLAQPSLRVPSHSPSYHVSRFHRAVESPIPL